MRFQTLFTLGDPPGPKGKFNRAHRKTRSVVERSFGVLKKRFSALGTILRVKDMVLASKLIECGCILHNLAIHHGYSGEDLQDDDQPQDGQASGQEGQAHLEGLGPQEPEQDPPRERRRNELLACFQ